MIYSCRRCAAWAFHADYVSLPVLKCILSIYLGADPLQILQSVILDLSFSNACRYPNNSREYPTVLLAGSQEGSKHSVKED